MYKKELGQRIVTKEVLDYLIGIDKEIYLYLRKKPQSRCTLTQMGKPGGLREGGVSRGWLKKHLAGLEKRGIIYSQAVTDPVRNVTYKYYTLVPTCKPGDIGIPDFIEQNTSLYQQIATEYYSILESVYSPLAKEYCELCEDFVESSPGINQENWSCFDFLMLYQAWSNNKVAKDRSETEIDTFKRKADAWNQKQTLNPPLLLEELTLALIDWTVSHGPVDAEEGMSILCDECKGIMSCQDQGIRWISDLLKDYLNRIPESDLKTFWQCIMQGIPEIKTDLLLNYFESRFNLKKEHKSLDILGVYEAGALPFLYSKVIPRSFAFLVENILFSNIKKISTLYSNSAKRFKLVSRT